MRSELASVRQEILETETPPLLAAISFSFQWRAQDALALALALREGGYTGHITGGGHFGFFGTPVQDHWVPLETR